MCGEKFWAFFSRFPCVGSPPRVRGKEIRHPAHQHLPGITPACAGKRCDSNTRSSCGRDHPRVCGEKLLHQPILPSHLGSPPRVRGKAGDARINAPAPGITPACAGKRNPHPSGCASIRDHPRVCGEKIWAARFAVASRGSPPHMRGKVSHAYKDYAAVRITPAYAGKSARAV